MRPLPEASFHRWRRRGGKYGMALLLGLTLLAIFGPLVLPDPAAQPDIVAGARPPTWQHLFGTDSLNRDVLSRVVYGARISLGVAGLAMTLSLVLGATVGLDRRLCGWLGRRGPHAPGRRGPGHPASVSPAAVDRCLGRILLSCRSSLPSGSPGGSAPAGS